MTKIVSIHWFRQDLRLIDNPALLAASKAGQVLPIYILDDINAGDHAMGGASRWWLHHSLCALNKSLKNKLLVLRGDPKKIISKLVKNYNINSIYWNRCYEPWRIKRDKQIKADLESSGISVNTYNGSLLWEPWEVLKSDGTPYKVFTPFYRNGCLQVAAPREPLAKPKRMSFVDHSESDGAVTIDQLRLLPTMSWDTEMAKQWKIGEKAAIRRLDDFLAGDIDDYKAGRDFPAKQSVSRLSPHLHWGEISPNQIWQAVSLLPETENTEHFLRELGWREFSYSLLYYFPELPEKNWQEKFNRFAWRRDARALSRWQRGLTGYPIVDAGMRELWQTGYMHNRVRMIVGSFLVKNLLLHWREGEAWFWDCLLDADLASNSASWQWVAGCGADAAPYFRIFNPVTQGQKFDGDGAYTRRYLPELADLPDRYLFSPWEAPELVLREAGVVLGKTYPKPVVDLKASRERALAAFQALKIPAE